MTRTERQGLIYGLVRGYDDSLAIMGPERLNYEAIALEITARVGAPVIVFLAGGRLVGYELPGWNPGSTTK